MPGIIRMALGAAAAFFALHAAAEDGVGATTIRIGQTVGLTGQVAEAVKELNEGALAYLRHVNKNGGVHGRQIELVTLDDRFDPTQAGSNAKALVKDHRVFALFQSRGTPHTEAMLPVLKEYGVPLIAPSTGASSLHTPVNRYVFNVRTKYSTEIVKAVAHFKMIGIRRIGLLHVDDSFGRDALDAFGTAMDSAALQPALVAHFAREKPDIEAVAQAALKADAQMLLIVSSASTAARIIAALRTGGSKAQVMTLSNNASLSFVKSLGPNAKGVIITQVTPPAHAITSELGKEFRAVSREGGVTASYSAMEGFVAAKVLVEGLRRAGPQPTREKLIQGLESIKSLDLGGIMVSYSAQDHTGSEFVEPTIIGSDGSFRR